MPSPGWRWRPDQQRGGVPVGPAPHDRRRPRLVSGALRLRGLPQLRQVHPPRARLEHASLSTCARPSAPPPARRRAWPWSRSPKMSSTTQATSPNRCRGPGLRGRSAARPGRPAGDRTGRPAPARRRATAAGRRRRGVLVRRRSRAAGAGRADVHARSTAAGPGRARWPRTIRWPCGARGKSRSPAGPTWSSASDSASGAARTSANRRPGPTDATHVQIDSDPRRVGSTWRPTCRSSATPSWCCAR